ncbi:MCE family protein [Nocardioides sp. W3-2-3]|uniref:MlaD family protein n=1 Tax=Nocardioides convexus TaxID=2712224 RepID=UPI002418B06A|nr:MlaD family protein [Nocardioides convexus]NGZ99898.1 MCE family protein [Nocardioides convexus]
MTYRGVKVGKVREIVPSKKGVEATVAITSGTKIPKGSLAKVRSLSPVGEQYLDFQPPKAGGPFLASGDVIPAESTDLPKSLRLDGDRGQQRAAPDRRQEGCGSC